jgi:hypothetical protein
MGYHESADGLIMGLQASAWQVEKHRPDTHWLAAANL